jgi:nitrate reductase delta subunit
VVLEFASTQPVPQAKAFLAEIAHILRAIFSALEKRQSHYASVVAAVMELAGEHAHAVAIPDEAELDESWSEPAVFGGCSVEGQAKPSQPQPIQMVRKTHTNTGARP